MAGGGSGGEVFVDICCRQVAAVRWWSASSQVRNLIVSVISCLAERFGPSVAWPGAGVAAQPAQVVPGRELFNGRSDSWLMHGVEFGGQPRLEAGQVFVACGEQSVVFEQAAQMIDSGGPTRLRRGPHG